MDKLSIRLYILLILVVLTGCYELESAKENNLESPLELADGALSIQNGKDVKPINISQMDNASGNTITYWSGHRL